LNVELRFGFGLFSFHWLKSNGLRNWLKVTPGGRKRWAWLKANSEMELPQKNPARQSRNQNQTAVGPSG